MRGIYLLVLLVAVTSSAVAQSLQPTGLVNDFADAMYPGARTELQSILESVAAQADTDLAVVTTSSTSGLTIDALTRELFREWASRQKHPDHCVLIVFSPLQGLRIAVAPGLAPILPEYLVERVIREDFGPALQSQTPGEAIVYGTRKIADILRAKNVAPPPAPPETVASRLRKIDGFEWVLIGIAALFVGGAAFELGAGVGAKAIFPVVKALVLAGFVITVQTLLLGALASSGVGGVVEFPLALAGGLFGLRKGRSPRWRRTTRGGKGGSSWVWGTNAQAIGMQRRSSSSGDSVISSGDSSGSSSDSGGSSDSFGGGESGGGGSSESY